MKKTLLLIALITFSVMASAQKSSLTIKTGYTSSLVDNFDKIVTSPVKSPEFGLGYTYSFSKVFSLSIEPGLKIAGYSYKETVPGSVINKKVSSAYFNAPIVALVNFGANKIIAGIEAGYNPNFKLSGNNPNYSEVLMGVRAGYKMSKRMSIEAYYRYGESVKPYVSTKALSTNYISIQTRIYLGKTN